MRVPDDFIVSAIGNDPLILAILNLESIDELTLKGVRVLGNEVLGTFIERTHARGVKG
jgi:hypothetical protein